MSITQRFAASLLITLLMSCSRAPPPRSVLRPSVGAEESRAADNDPPSITTNEITDMPHDWRNHPQLQALLHPEYPDDLQVIVHDGGPRMTDRRPEVVWVRIRTVEDNVFTAEVLNQPRQLASVRQGDRIRFIIPPPASIR
jgi:hypothetical protein